MSASLPGLQDRIRECARRVGSGDALAAKAGIPRRTLENYLSGRSEPKASAIFAIAKNAGVSLEWLLGGDEALPLSPAPYALVAPPLWLDEDLLAAITDGIAQVHREEGRPITEADKGRLIARLHNDLFAAYEAPEERLVGLKGALHQLRVQLRAGAAR